MLPRDVVRVQSHLQATSHLPPAGGHEARLTNGLAEGMNNHLRMVARRAYGFHSAKALIAMAFLCCGGVEINPPLPT